MVAVKYDPQKVEKEERENKQRKLKEIEKARMKSKQSMYSKEATAV